MLAQVGKSEASVNPGAGGGWMCCPAGTELGIVEKRDYSKPNIELACYDKDDPELPKAAMTLQMMFDEGDITQRHCGKALRLEALERRLPSRCVPDASPTQETERREAQVQKLERAGQRAEQQQKRP